MSLRSSSSGSRNGNQEESATSNNKYKAKIRIGSIHGRLEFERNAKAFQKSDIPEEKRQAVLEVKQASRPKYLSNAPPSWNQSTETDALPCVRNLNQISKFDHPIYKFNHRTEELHKNDIPYLPRTGKFNFSQYKGKTISKMPQRKRLEEMPIHSKLADKSKWNHSTELLPEDREVWMKRDIQQRERIIANRKVTISDYKTPAQLQVDYMAYLRKKKMGLITPDEVEITQKSKNQVNHEKRILKAKAKKERTHSKSSQSRKYKEYYNDGVWEFNSAEGAYVWSCSMNPNKDFRGSSYKVKNPDSFNY